MLEVCARGGMASVIPLHFVKMLGTKDKLAIVGKCRPFKILLVGKVFEL